MAIEQRLLRGDLHIHTGGHDAGEHTVLDGIDAAEREGLAFIAFSNHDSIRGTTEAIQRGEEKGITVLPAVEINTRAGLRLAHMEAINLSPRAYENNRRHFVLKSTVDVAKRIHELGGYVSIPHPKPRGGWMSLSFRRLEALASEGLVDFIEVTIDGIIDSQIVDLAERLGIPTIGSSDAHRKEDVGNGYTEVEARSNRKEDILEAIKNGKSRAIGMKRGTLYSLGKVQNFKRRLIDKIT